jgi:ABC-type glycerol-3-phosphate transport system permease component
MMYQPKHPLCHPLGAAQGVLVLVRCSYGALALDGTCGDTGFAWNKILALSLISILPQLIVFFCAQDQFVEGISAGAVKG